VLGQRSNAGRKGGKVGHSTHLENPTKEQRQQYAERMRSIAEETSKREEKQRKHEERIQKQKLTRNWRSLSNEVKGRQITSKRKRKKG
tara:strand:+ start:346 stop:609 length:264 start_codon:yes stop_codon:yes gene_type:complete